MTPSPAGFHARVAGRLVPFPPAPCDAARDVMRALRSSRPSDARRYTHRLPRETKGQLAWCWYLESRILIEDGAYSAAVDAARRAASESMSLGLREPVDRNALQLAGAAFEAHGFALRRQDRCTEASRMHSAALELRRQYATPAEQLESVLSLAACAEWNNDERAAERWLRIAIGFNDIEPNVVLLKASSLIRYSCFLTNSARHAEAIAVSRRAQTLLDEHMPGELASAAAGITAANALIRLVEFNLQEDPDAALHSLKTAAQYVTCLRETLSGFGTAARGELAWCDEQFELLEQLRQVLDTGESNGPTA